MGDAEVYWNNGMSAQTRREWLYRETHPDVDTPESWAEYEKRIAEAADDDTNAAFDELPDPEPRDSSGGQDLPPDDETRRR